MSTVTIESEVVDGADATKALASSLAGTIVEWYEFFVYGIAAALVFGRLFFPSFDPLVGTLLSLSTFAVAFIARPIGAAVFGHLGDRIGRKSSLIITLSLMGGATFLIGLLPTYDAIGIWAPVTLVVVRIVQGFSLGGEYSGAVLISVEHAGPGRRGLFGSIVNTGSAFGLILANLAFLALSALDESQFLSWGWRIPFVLSAILVVVGMVIRARVSESPDFEEVKSRAHLVKTPLLETFKDYKGRLILLALAYVGAGTFFYTASVFSLSYAQHLGVPRGEMLILVMGAFLFLAVAMVFFGWLSDRINRKMIFVAGAAVMTVAPFIWFSLLETRSFSLMLLGFIIMFVPFAANYGVMPTFYTEVFPLKVRYTGMAIGYTLGTIFGSATAPLMGTYLLGATGNWYAIAAFMGGASLISAVAGTLLYVVPEDPDAANTLSRVGQER
ncbi:MULTISPECIES: MFS transporter [unclassified Bradyrhizobium]|uniref:MFS transporter n=1 Tax=unclassified Bradyrhizobium TaxID=2631580 RepID=UPI00102E6DCC|nr:MULTISPECIES: MFS transporter [unclassified Bradyrhizobium]MDI4233547.1 MFS transporter [Bradyrhizobium sp. Arg237L]TAI66494.1 MFS transporter [Bradyrhizobium sp. Leo170]